MDTELNPSMTGPQPSPKTQKSTTDYEKEWQEKNRREKENQRKRVFIDLIGGIRAFEEYTLDTFHRKDTPAYWSALKFKPEKHNLYFWGPSWVGKTHLSTALAHKFFDLGCSVHVVSIPEFKDTLRRLESQFDYTEKKKFIDNFVNADVLVLHELGRGPATEHIQETLWTILDRRILARRNGLIVTSNFPLKDIAIRYGGTISERLKDMCGTAGVIQFSPRGFEVL